MTTPTVPEPLNCSLPDAALLIGGDRVKSTSSGIMEKINPTTGKLLGTFPVAGPGEVDKAVAAARKAFSAWRAMPADKRRRIFYEVVSTLRAHETELRTINAMETGSPMALNSLEVTYDNLEYYAGWSDKLAGELVHSYPWAALNYVKYEPYGVIGALVSWNGPVNNASMVIAPALAAGNTVVLRPSEFAPFAAMPMAELFMEAGLPEGVINVVTGGAVTGEAVVRHPDVAKVSLTASGVTARKVLAAAAEGIKPVVLELGGKSANIVFGDADLDNASIMATMMSVIAFSGQGRLFPTRLLVEDGIYDQFVERVIAVSKTANIGNPLNRDTTMGPVVSEAQCKRILSAIEEAKACGNASLVSGGNRVGGELADGYFIEPTIFANVDNTCALAQEEIFGPVLAVVRFKTEEEAIRLANDTKCGLAAFIHTNDLRRAHRVAGAMEAGYIGINAFPPFNATSPFGGVKQSGFGREGGKEGIYEFLSHKSIYLPLD